MKQQLDWVLHAKLHKRISTLDNRCYTPECLTERKQVKHVTENKATLLYQWRNQGLYVRANVPRYNKRLCELKCIWFKARYETVAICKKLTRIYIYIPTCMNKSMGIYIQNCISYILCNIIVLCTECLYTYKYI